MRRVGVVALALVMLLAGCPADGEVEATVTPADVPDIPSPTPTPASSLTVECDVPTPPAPDAQPEPPSGAVSIPMDGGVVNGSALADRHETVLSNHRYQLAAPGRSILVTENWSAIRAAVGESGSSISHYAVNDTRYTYYFEDGGRTRFGISSYEPGPSLTGFGGTISLTGAPTVERVLSAYPHRVDRVRADGWTVLQASLEEWEEDNEVGVESLNSTVLVDRRGIVRRVDTRVVPNGSVPGDVPLTGSTFLSIKHVGSITFERPNWVCRAAGQSGPDEDTARQTSS